MSDAIVYLPAEPSSAALARTFVEHTLDRNGVGNQPDVVLLTSELVTNAVVHAQSDVILTVHCERNRVRVSVRDSSDSLPVPQDPVDMATSGRGLRIVEALSDRWGVDVDASGGKVTWFEMGYDSRGSLKL